MSRSKMFVLALSMVFFVCCAVITHLMFAGDKIANFIFIFIPGNTFLFLGAVIGKKWNRIITGAVIGLAVGIVLTLTAIGALLYAIGRYGT